MIYIDGFPALPSQFQLGDHVRAHGKLGVVTGVLFRACKVFYEVGGVIFASDDVKAPMTLVTEGG